LRNAELLARCSSGGSLKANKTVDQLAQAHASTFVGIFAAPLTRPSPHKSHPTATGLRADSAAAASSSSPAPAAAVPSFSKRRVIRPTFLGYFNPQLAPSLPFESAFEWTIYRC